jgi:hypothetical protein
MTLSSATIGRPFKPSGIGAPLQPSDTPGMLAPSKKARGAVADLDADAPIPPVRLDEDFKF